MQPNSPSVPRAVRLASPSASRRHSKLLPFPRTRTGITEHWAETIDIVKKVEVMAKKADISIKASGPAWVPRQRVTCEDKGMTKQFSPPAYDKIQEANDDQQF